VLPARREILHFAKNGPATKIHISPEIGTYVNAAGQLDVSALNGGAAERCVPDRIVAS
jgi:hypothetical protein